MNNKLIDDKNNIAAIFFSLTTSIINKQPINNYLTESHSQYLDINFLKAIFLWTNIEQSNVDKLNIEDCVPLICLHKGMLLLVQGKKKEALTFLTKVEEQNFSSIRIKELLFYSFLKHNKKNKAEKFFKEMSLKDSNLSISFGKQTWPHLLVRIMLIEQIYRSLEIIKGSPYHK